MGRQLAALQALLDALLLVDVALDGRRRCPGRARCRKSSVPMASARAVRGIRMAGPPRLRCGAGPRPIPRRRASPTPDPRSKMTRNVVSGCYGRAAGGSHAGTRNAGRAQHADHPHGGFATLVIAGDAKGFGKAGRLVQRVRRGIAGAELDVNRRDPGGGRRSDEPIQHPPRDAAPARSDVDRQQHEMRSLVAEAHDGEPGDPAGAPRDDRRDRRIGDQRRHPRRAVRPSKSRLDEVARHRARACRLRAGGPIRVRSWRSAWRELCH